jgi:hypothetical protein
MFEVIEGGVSVEGELYRVPEELWPRVEAGEPPGLYVGRVRLRDGRDVFGVLYPREMVEGLHTDISEYGGWRAYISGLRTEGVIRGRDRVRGRGAYPQGE